MFVWCELPERVDMMDFCKRAVEKKVAVVPGSAFTVEPDEVVNSIRLNFTTPSDERIVEGMHILGELSHAL